MFKTGFTSFSKKPWLAVQDNFDLANTGNGGPCTRITEHDRDMQLAGNQSLAVTEHAYETGYYSLWNEVK